MDFQFNLKKPQDTEIVERLERYRRAYEKHVLKNGVYDGKMVGKEKLRLAVLNELLDVGGVDLEALLLDLKKAYGKEVEPGDYFSAVGRIQRYIQDKNKEAQMRRRGTLERLSKKGS